MADSKIYIPYDYVVELATALQLSKTSEATIMMNVYGIGTFVIERVIGSVDLFGGVTLTLNELPKVDDGQP